MRVLVQRGQCWSVAVLASIGGIGMAVIFLAMRSSQSQRPLPRHPKKTTPLHKRRRCPFLCHRPANVTASGPGGVIQKKNRKISNGQRGLPRRPGSSPAVEDGACQGARSDERSSLALDWRWPLPHRTVRIVSVNSVSGSVPPVPTRSVGPVHDRGTDIRIPIDRLQVWSRVPDQVVPNS